MACTANTRFLVLFCRRFALVSAVGQAKIERRQRIRHRAFVSSKQATLGRAANLLECI